MDKTPTLSVAAFILIIQQKLNAAEEEMYAANIDEQGKAIYYKGRVAALKDLLELFEKRV